ncbi:MAG TPA: VOC family protein [Candidatus Dormibacteraeota bacterium]|nr:VOC family protein [Candidatus Dormibacteraeota bacterium]
MKNPVLWFEVVGKEGGKLQRFYKDVFGWEISGADGDESYGLVAASDGGIGGGVGQSQEGDGHVTFFIEVDDPSAYLKKVEKAGGETMVPPTEVPNYNLTFAYFKDPAGHTIGLSKGVAR